MLSYDTSASAAKKIKPDNIVPKAANGASMVLIQSQSASSSATLDFETGLDDTYDAYELVVSGLKPATNNVQLGSGSTMAADTKPADTAML